MFKHPLWEQVHKNFWAFLIACKYSVFFPAGWLFQCFPFFFLKKKKGGGGSKWLAFFTILLTGISTKELARVTFRYMYMRKPSYFQCVPIWALWDIAHIKRSVLDGLYKGWSDSAVSAVYLRTALVGVFTCDSYIKSACNLSILPLLCFLPFFHSFFCVCVCVTATQMDHHHKLLTTGPFMWACCATSDATCHLYKFHRSIIGGQSCFLSETGDKQYFS